MATAIGGVLGVVLGVLAMRLFERSLVYYLENVGVPFLWVDLPRTIERLESLGVPVFGFGTREFPAFYRRASGLPRVPMRRRGVVMASL